MLERVIHALDLGMLGDWEGAKRSLEHIDHPIVPRLLALLTEQQRLERERGEAQALARHELGNAISVAQANVEAMADGVLEPTAERLSTIRDALAHSGSLLEQLRRQQRRPRESSGAGQAFDLPRLAEAQISLISPIAEAKNVRIAMGRQNDARSGSAQMYVGDAERMAQAIRHVMLSAVRYTPPGGVITIEQICSGGEMLLSVDIGSAASANAMGFSMLSALLDAVGSQAHVTREDTTAASISIALPAVPLA